jgi:succinate dehydrogenase / fumarate reductase iron-sulfur subunit
MTETGEEKVVTFTIHRTRRPNAPAGDTRGSTGGDTRHHTAAEATSCEAPPLAITLSAGPMTTVLDILERVRLSRDPSLMYRHSCHHGSCGTCACLIDGKERLACATRVLELASSRVTVEPLLNMANTGDLTVDFSSFFQEIPASWTYLRESERREGSHIPPGIERFTRFENCIECGSCVSACPVTEGYLGPASLAFLHREMRNNPDSSLRLLVLASGERGVKKCVRALECSRVCPAGVYPARHIADLKRAT